MDSRVPTRISSSLPSAPSPPLLSYSAQLRTVRAPADAISDCFSSADAYYSVAYTPVPDRHDDELAQTYARQSQFKEEESELSHENLYAEGPAKVVSLGVRDDYKILHGWRRILFFLSPLTSIGSQGSSIVYLMLRGLYTRRAEMEAKRSFYSAWTFVAIESILSISTMIHASWTIFLWRGRKRPQLRLVGSKGLPSIDVFVCCCGEEVDVVMDTVKAACTIDWPVERFRVLVLDDGGSDDLKRLVEAYSHLYAPNLVYHRRVKIKGVPHHAKAGNINGGLERTRTLGWGWQGPGEYILSLDADMIARPEIARALIAHLYLDPNLCLAGSPQYFYNIPDGDPLSQDLRTFFDSVEPIKDSAGVAWCTGSGFAMRRKALDDIGGFPTGSLAEDVYCSSLMLGMGYKAAFIHEHLQCGLVPDSLAGHLKQRTRWTLGTMQTTKKLNWFLFGDRIKQMTIMQRLSGLTYAISSLFNIAICGTFVVFPFVLYSDGNLVPVTNPNQMKLLIRLVFMQILCGRLHELIWSLPGGYLGVRREIQAWAWMAPYHSIILIRSILPRWLGGHASAFKASGSISDGLHERDPDRRAPLWRRAWFMLFECKVWMHVVILAATIASVGLALYRVLTRWIRGRYSFEVVGYELLTKVFWPPIMWLILSLGLWIPILYTISPPDMPDREELLVRDARGVAQPKPERTMTGPWKSHSFSELLMSFTTAFTVACFVLTFFFEFEAPDCKALDSCPKT
ncbi:glycosyltransferase family 2 protein [Violaceomyces palustris]|uniref:Glycosyltransferase family 2 protein n=1 Tax=Violaceomyces palustris TaxID=1673888 RepID=A0ACD0NXY6_9BASI|nr:glycosyltransferase family 2 protein [Violaceomyces palustris]